MSDGAAKPQTNGQTDTTRHGTQTRETLHTATQQMKAHTLTQAQPGTSSGRLWPQGLKSDLPAVLLSLLPSLTHPSWLMKSFIHPSVPPQPKKSPSLPRPSLLTRTSGACSALPQSFHLTPVGPKLPRLPAQNLSLPSPEPILMSPLCWMKMVSQVRFPWMMGGSQECR